MASVASLRERAPRETHASPGGVPLDAQRAMAISLKSLLQEMEQGVIKLDRPTASAPSPGRGLESSRARTRLGKRHKQLSQVQPQPETLARAGEDGGDEEAEEEVEQFGGFEAKSGLVLQEPRDGWTDGRPSKSAPHRARLRSECVKLGGCCCVILLVLGVGFTRKLAAVGGDVTMPPLQPKHTHSGSRSHHDAPAPPSPAPAPPLPSPSPSPSSPPQQPPPPHSFPPPRPPASSPRPLQPPPGPQLPPPATPISVVDRINARYRNVDLSWAAGMPITDLGGVLVHGVDSQEDPERPWAVCSPKSPSCGFLSDRMSTSLIFRGKGTTSFGGGGGVILNPLATRILCAYGGDGGTRGKLCHPPGLSETCIPGCISPDSDPHSAGWCKPSEALGSSWCDGHPWKPSDLGQFLKLDQASQGYNEIMVDGFYWNAQLPHSIEAIVTSPGDPQAQAMHAKFIKAYGLKASDVPLVSFNKASIDSPFALQWDGAFNFGGELYSEDNGVGFSFGSEGEAVPGSLPTDGVKGATPVNPSNNLVIPNSGDISGLGYGRA